MTEPTCPVDRGRLSVILSALILAVAAAFVVDARPAAAQEPDTTGEAETREVRPDTTPRLQSRRPRRRASPRMSNVGYVDNAVVGTQLQVRFDYNAGIDRADRAEFIQGKCGCYRQLDRDPDAPGAADPDVEDPFSEAIIGTEAQYLDYALDAEFAFHPRASVFAEIVYRTAQVAGVRDWVGWGDAAVGFKAAILMQPERFLTAQLRTYLPTGDASEGLGTDHVSLEPSLLLYNELTSRARLEAEVRYWVPLGGSTGKGVEGFDDSDDYAGPVLRYGAGLGYDLIEDSWLRFTPVVEVVGWQVLGGLATYSENGRASGLESEDATGTMILNVKTGARIGLGGHDLFAGIGFALTEDVWYDQIIRVEYRWDL